MSITEENMHIHSNITNILTNSLKSQIYKRIKPVLFDVSLRDGIQKADPLKYTTAVKKTIFHKIFTKYSPNKIEIGSMVSPKVLPIMEDSVSLHEYIMNSLDERCSPMDPYVLVPNNRYLRKALTNGMYNFSFITSVSNAFQLKNTKTTIFETKGELREMELTLNCYRRTHNRKLYVSCINECPLTGKIDNDFIVSELLYYHTNYDFTEICLSDTMGTLTFEDFEYIVDTIQYFGFPINKISLHLHILESNYDEFQQIMYYCFDKGINKFDVSVLTEGGCSVTMGNSAPPNLTYEQFYDVLSAYIDKKVK